MLSDLKMGGSDGLDVLRTTRAMHPTTAVILMTAFASVMSASALVNGMTSWRGCKRANKSWPRIPWLLVVRVFTKDHKLARVDRRCP